MQLLANDGVRCTEHWTTKLNELFAAVPPEPTGPPRYLDDLPAELPTSETIRLFSDRLPSESFQSGWKERSLFRRDTGPRYHPSPGWILRPWFDDVEVRDGGTTRVVVRTDWLTSRGEVVTVPASPGAYHRSAPHPPGGQATVTRPRMIPTDTVPRVKNPEFERWLRQVLSQIAPLDQRLDSTTWGFIPAVDSLLLDERELIMRDWRDREN